VSLGAAWDWCGEPKAGAATPAPATACFARGAALPIPANPDASPYPAPPPPPSPPPHPQLPQGHAGLQDAGIHGDQGLGRGEPDGVEEVRPHIHRALKQGVWVSGGELPARRFAWASHTGASFAAAAFVTGWAGPRPRRAAGAAARRASAQGVAAQRAPHLTRRASHPSALPCIGDAGVCQHHPLQHLRLRLAARRRVPAPRGRARRRRDGHQLSGPARAGERRGAGRAADAAAARRASLSPPPGRSPPPSPQPAERAGSF
jgi:hypothetical protein